MFYVRFGQVQTSAHMRARPGSAIQATSRTAARALSVDQLIRYLTKIVLGLPASMVFIA
jgi:hypothetical protein